MSRVSANLVPGDGILPHGTANFERKLVDRLFLATALVPGGSPGSLEVRGPGVRRPLAGYGAPVGISASLLGLGACQPRLVAAFFLIANKSRTIKIMSAA